MSDTGTGGARTDNASNSTWRNDPRASYAASAYDPYLQPQLFTGVLTKRFLAFLVDLIVLAIPIILLSIFILVFGVVTLGLGWFLFWLVSPFSVIWALIYYGASLGGAHGATLGMRMMSIQMRTRTGEAPYFMLGVIHAVLYWLSVSFLTPFIVLIGLFNARSQLLHDLILGTVFINTGVSTAPTINATRV